MELPEFDYTGVCVHKTNNQVFCLRASITKDGKKKYKDFPLSQSRKAALWYDKKRIEYGMEPVNILKPLVK